MHEWVVTPQEQGLKLQAFLKLKLGASYSNRQIKYALDHAACTINGHVERFASATVGAGHKITFHIDPVTAKPVFEKSRVLYEDNHFLIYNKPPGISSDAEGLERLLGFPLIHRLDKDTSGVIMAAKHTDVFNEMVLLFKQFQVSKSYLAIVDQVPKKSHGVIENHLGKISAWQGQTQWGEVPAQKGQYACTEWSLLKKGRNNASLLECYPKTGRTHQLRVHLAQMGHPILGDAQYGKRFVCSFHPARILLHAHTLKFMHPLTQKSLQVTAPLPDDFNQAIHLLME